MAYARVLLVTHLGVTGCSHHGVTKSVVLLSTKAAAVRYATTCMHTNHVVTVVILHGSL